VPVLKLGFFVKIKEDENFNHSNTLVVFRGLKFEFDADIDEKGSFNPGTN